MLSGSFQLFLPNIVCSHLESLTPVASNMDGEQVLGLESCNHGLKMAFKTFGSASD
jgi:hypothetical protein